MGNLDHCRWLRFQVVQPCERAGCSHQSTVRMSVEIQGRVVYWDPVAMSRRAGATLCFLHATEVNLGGPWTICDRRGRHPVIHVPPIEWETLRHPSEWPVVGHDTARRSAHPPWTPAGRTEVGVVGRAAVTVEQPDLSEPATVGAAQRVGSARSTDIPATDRGSAGATARRPEPSAVDLRLDLDSVQSHAEGSSVSRLETADITAPIPPPGLPGVVGSGPRPSRPWWVRSKVAVPRGASRFAGERTAESVAEGRGGTVSMERREEPGLTPGRGRSRGPDRPKGPLLRRAFEGPSAEPSPPDGVDS
jgi:hypothetical protein